MNNADIEKIEMLSDSVFETVLDQLDFNEDLEYREATKNLLKQQAFARVILSVWSAMSEEDSQEFKARMDRESQKEGHSRVDSQLVEFAFEKPLIMEAVQDELNKFFQSFIERFRAFNAE